MAAGPRPEDASACHNEFSGSAAGSVVQAGNIDGGVHIHDWPVARSAYLHQVRRIAPAELRDRDQELAELVEWCRRPGPGYLWWRAPAWFGKSALLSWFVLHPPAGVRMVSFFITAALSNQSDKVAFADVVLEQLAEVLEEPLPEGLSEATGDAHLREMLERAAVACERRGERLVLVVDGLDEDRGVVAGPYSYSIAALLPERPRLRVIVSGRPDPPIPPDVPERHPLRDPEIVRELSRSRHAEVVRKDAQRELKHLLWGSPAEQDLVGLLAAAGGGLSAPDLAELTGHSPWEIEEHLHTVSGRTFLRRAPDWGLRSDPPVYLLGHQQLQQEATRMLGENRLAGYRRRLHDWADGYRDRGWPPGTPEYLLRGYYRLLQDTSDTERLVRCALDRARHDRMPDLATAQAEVTAAQDLLTPAAEPDLFTLLRLAIQRDNLADRDERIPAEVALAWAHLGHLSYAEVLARSMTNSYHRNDALLGLADIIAETGDLDRAICLVKDTTHPTEQSRTVARLVTTRSIDWLVAAGEPDRAEQLARAGGDPEVLAGLVLALANAGDAARVSALAVEVAKSASSPATLVEAAVKTGDLVAAEKFARSMDDPYERVKALTSCVKARVRAGADAAALAAEVETLATSVDSPRRDWALAKAAEAMAVTGKLEEAENLARSLKTSGDRISALTAVAAVEPGALLAELETLVRAMPRSLDQFARASDLIEVLTAAGQPDRAEAVARSIREPNSQAQLLEKLVRFAGRDPARAEALVRSVGEPYHRSRMLAGLVREVARSGGIARAEALATEAEALARAETGPSWRTPDLVALARAVAATGDAVRAEAVARRIPAPGIQATILAAPAGAETPVSRHKPPDEIARVRQIADAGDLEGAKALIWSTVDPEDRDVALQMVVRSAAEAGDIDGGGEIVRLIRDPHTLSEAELALVEALANAGDLERAEALSASLVFPEYRARAALALVKALVGNDIARAETLARSIGQKERRVEALAVVAAAGETRHARRILADALREGHWTELLTAFEPEIVLALADEVLGAGSGSEHSP
ncbi:hypothetical protein [Amycolatopsis sp.]|uniref:hypothetical protein n=1 Tax=Amycolatopsis sp. TaxID=37632 RepID=UPI002B55687D|nr:hypothetical protein [Amycolatopsis sp.]HVV09550.1 hypothetical protein [Amycolatopsis sp.]